MTTWIDSFQELIATSANPAALADTKAEYIRWIQERGNFYATLNKTCPEFLELLGKIEALLGIQVKIEQPKTEPKEQE